MLLNFLEEIELFLAALIASLFGQGGGVLYTPIQLWNGQDFHEAASISLFLIMLTSFSATLIYRKSNKIDWLLALLFEIPTTLGAFIGGYLSHYISGTNLQFVLSFLLLVAAYFIFFPPKEKKKHKSLASHSRWIIQHRKNEHSYSIDLRLLIPIALLTGAFTGMIGIGGGILKLPVMLLIFDIPLPIAVGSSAFMVGITASGGLLGHISQNHFNWQQALLLAIPVFIGALAGSYLSIRLHAAKLVKYFGVFLLAIAVYTAYRTFTHL